MDIRFKHAAIIIVALVGVGFANESFFRRKNIEVVEEDEPIIRKVKRSISSVNEKAANFYQGPKAYEPGVTSSALDRPFEQNTYVPEPADSVDEPAPSVAGSSVGSNTSSDNGGPSYYGPGSSGGLSSSGNGSSTSKSTTTTTTTSSGTTSLPQGAVFFGNVSSATGSSGTLPTPASPNPTYVSDALNCSPSVGGGAFGQPIQVSLTCSSSSTIKFCVQENTCCDPEVEGTSYSAPIVLGGQNGTYCLSYVGIGKGSKLSMVSHQSYTFNNTFPDLQVNFPKINYQTTQLAGYNFLTSSDFGKSNFQIGEINLKNHDPGPSGLQLDCSEIVEQSSSLTASVPELIFAPMDQSMITPGNQLNVPLSLTKLIYGDNFITSYSADLNYPAPLYSCSTNKVVLNDFEFFDAEATHGDVGSNSVREFSASFVSYGFFETDADLNRLPAGSANEADSGQELRTGSFGIFY